ncbi:MAG: SDR family NAD(P)-dependent oxidoreductase, partial [Chloroflexi bacterium]|nr:SDR family NAD(P)-dependent oxidoreductase [Chloroflexota bacterium]
MDLKLKGKRALVTGSSRGLGYATALALAKEGCRLAINSRDEARASAAAAKISAETGGKALGLAGDVADPAVPERLVNEAARRLGGPSTGSRRARPASSGQGLDILVTNAGGPPAGTFESFDEAAWQK